jgi:hypothetical protein
MTILGSFKTMMTNKKMLKFNKKRMKQSIIWLNKTRLWIINNYENYQVCIWNSVFLYLKSKKKLFKNLIKTIFLFRKFERLLKNVKSEK